MGLLNLIGILVEIYSLAIFARLLITWVPNLDPYHPVVQFLNQATEPVLEPARKLIPPIGMVDISPVIVLVVLQFLASALLNRG
jgi:YggT family protein